MCRLKEYFDMDYKYLKQCNLERFIMMARDRVAKKYLSMVLNPSTSILSIRKQRFESEAERKDAADKIRKEGAQLMTCFREIGSECGIETDLEFDSPFMAIGAVADIIRADRDILMLDIGTFAKDYPDASEAQVLALLAVRGDLSKTEAKDLVPDASNTRAPKTRSIFSQV